MRPQDFGDAAAVVLGAYVNAYAIISELHHFHIRNIVVISDAENVAFRSRKVRAAMVVPKTEGGLLKVLNEIASAYPKVTVFSTADDHVGLLDAIRPGLSPRVFVPFRPGTAALLDKVTQYRASISLGVPCPPFVVVRQDDDWCLTASLSFPLIAKPINRFAARHAQIPRNVVIQTQRDLESVQARLCGAIRDGFHYVVSEIIPGPSSNIFAYCAYRSADSGVLNEWCGRKLSQTPNDFGVFSSASNEARAEVAEQGRRLVEGMGLTGFCQPEFKLDERDGAYKLMEINMRSMMWNAVGFLSGVPLHYTQFLHSLGQVPPRRKMATKRIHYVNLASEIANLANQKGYFPTFRRALWGGDRLRLACFDLRDPQPFLALMKETLVPLLRRLAGRALR